MPVHIPAQIAGGGFVNRRRNRREVSSDMMFETLFADKVQQLLQIGNLDDAGSTESVQCVVGETAFTDVTPHLAGCVISGETGKAHFFWLDDADAGAASIFLARRSGDDLL